jgi:hypothetical protein
MLKSGIVDSLVYNIGCTAPVHKHGILCFRFLERDPNLGMKPHLKDGDG